MYFINGGDPAREKTCRVIEGTIKNTTISLDTCGVHWISVQTEMTVEEVVHTSDSIVGLDLGCVRYATLSSGAYYLPLNALDKQLDRLALLQQKMARQATRFT
jgi:putative transposase